MRPRSTALRTLGGIVALVLIAGLWLLFGPRQLGGPVTYALIQGNSMEPRLHANDLAVVRTKQSYAVGDVVAYHSAELDRLVLHRIIDRDGDTFILQGDNNDFLDSAQPTEEQIAGELAFSVPKAGALVERLRSPAGFVVLLGLAGVVIGSGRRQRRAAMQRDARAPTALQAGSSVIAAGRSMRHDQLQTVLGVAGGATVVLALVALLAFARPTSEQVVASDLYEQTGTFSYSAEVAESPAYDSTVAADGQAIFTALANDVDFSFDYRLTSSEPHSVRGTAALEALVTDGEGLERSLALTPEQEFTGSSVTLAGTLTLRKLQRLIRRIQKTTGAASNNYFVTLAPRVDVSGRVGEAPIEDAFAPQLVFRLDPTRLALAQSSALDDGANALVQSQMGSGPTTVAATFSVLGFEPSVDSVRRLSLLGALLGAIVFIVAYKLSRRRHGGEPATIAAHHGHQLVRATGGVPSDRRCIELAAMDDLLRVAELRGQLVLQIDEPDRTVYLVDDGSVHYRYATTEPASSHATDALHSSERDGSAKTADSEDQSAFQKDALGRWLPLARKLGGLGGTSGGPETPARSGHGTEPTEFEVSEPRDDEA